MSIIYEAPMLVMEAKMDSEKYKENLLERIWFTRTSRIHSEKRLMDKEDFYQFLNVYYSLITIILSILAYIWKCDTLSLLTIFMTISLLVAILYLNSQKYLEHAKEFRKNYTALQDLEFQLQHSSHQDTETIREIEKQYCCLLDSSNNHSSFDYYCAAHESKGEYRQKHYSKYISRRYWFFTIIGYIQNAFFILLPIVCILRFLHFF